MKTRSSAITQKGRLKTENGFQTAFLILETETRFRKSWPRRQESNLYFTLRRHTFYPLNYGEDLKLRKTKRNASIYITLATDTSASWRMARVASLSGSTSKQAAALPAAAFACAMQ